MITFGPNLGLIVNGDAGEAHYAPLMQMWRGLDLLVMPVVLSNLLTAPPAGPADGDAYIVAPSATGDWLGHDNAVVRWSALAAAWEFYPPKTGWEVYVAANDRDYRFDGAVWKNRGSKSHAEIITVGDETTAITAGTNKYTLHFPFAFDLTEVFIGLSTPQATDGAGGIFTVDVNVAGTSIFDVAKLTIDNTEETSLTAAVLPTLTTTAIARGAKVTIDVDQVGDGTAAGLKVYFVGVPR